MKIKTLLMFCLIAISTILSSCKKDEPAKPEPTREELLAGNQQYKSWKPTKVIISGVDVTDEIMEDCDMDDLSIFFKDKRYEENEGQMKCDPSEPQTTQGTWSFNSDKTVLNIISDDVSSATINELTENSMILSMFYDNVNMEMHFVAQ